MAQSETETETKSQSRVAIKRLTPVMIVAAVEPSLRFWEALGFARSIEVQEGDGEGDGARLGFVALEKDGVEVMVQTRATAARDLPQVDRRGSDAALYLEVADLAAVEAALPGAGAETVVRRRAPYGAEELFVREPGGHLIGFAERG
jgi:hypothetical protein